MGARKVDSRIWRDDTLFRQLSPDEKYMLLYILTNSHANLCGCYEISLRTIRDETGFETDQVLAVIDSLDKNWHLVCYSRETGEILAGPQLLSSWTASPMIQVHLYREIRRIKQPVFRIFVRATRLRLEEAYRYGHKSGRGNAWELKDFLI